MQIVWVKRISLLSNPHNPPRPRIKNPLLACLILANLKLFYMVLILIVNIVNLRTKYFLFSGEK